MRKLKPCPFCGESVVYYPPEDLNSIFTIQSDGTMLVDCFYCGASGPVAPNEVDAIAAWNRRATTRANKGRKP